MVDPPSEVAEESKGNSGEKVMAVKKMRERE